MALAESMLGIESDALKMEIPLFESVCVIMLGGTNNDGDAGTLSSPSPADSAGEAAEVDDGMTVDGGRFLGDEKHPAKRFVDRSACHGGSAGGGKMLKIAATSSGDKTPS